MAGYTERNGAVRVTVRLPGGGRETATFDTRAEAERWAADKERKKAAGALRGGAGSSALVSQLLEVYDAAVASKQDSARWNAIRFNVWMSDPLAKLRVGAVTTHDINGWIDRRGENVSGSTVNRELNLLSAAFTYAVKALKWIDVNPCHGAQRPERGRPRDRRLLTRDEIRSLCVATGYEGDGKLRTFTARVGACFLLALETGMRSGEILRLKPEHYFKDEGFVVVAAEERGGRKGSRSGRSQASRRVPLTARAVELLDQLIANPVKDSPYIAGLRDDQRDALWRKAVHLAGVEDLHFHDTKHEAATRLAKFLDVFQLSHAIGTKNLRLLRDTYYNNDVRQAVKLLPASLAA